MHGNLVHATDEAPGITRQRKGHGFAYIGTQGRALKDKSAIGRIRKLAIPPAWKDVWISPKANAHLQATGRDARGRKQYKYHPDFRAHQEKQKFDHILEFARALPRIRHAVQRHLALKGLPREKVLATVVRLLDTTLIRVGNEDYARKNGSYGLTTLRDKHVDIRGGELRFHFKGKCGKTWRLKLQNKRVAKIVRECQELPGQHLFQYCDDDGNPCEITSTDVNAYLRDVTGQDITAKDFRTWAGTVLAAMALQEFERVDSETAAKKNVREAIETVAASLGNTPTICRKCYIHPTILDTYMSQDLALSVKTRAASRLKNLHTLKPEEAAVLALLQKRLRRRSKAA